MMMEVTINGTTHSLPPGGSVLDAVAVLGLTLADTGVAVAVNSEVIPRDLWSDTAITDGARVEVVRAAAGG